MNGAGKNSGLVGGGPSQASMEYVQHNFRRRKCSDLKSVAERKAEMAIHDTMGLRNYI